MNDYQNQRVVGQKPAAEMYKVFTSPGPSSDFFPIHPTQPNKQSKKQSSRAGLYSLLFTPIFYYFSVFAGQFQELFQPP
jgi:hypothetical protein